MEKPGRWKNSLPTNRNAHSIFRSATPGEAYFSSKLVQIRLRGGVGCVSRCSWWRQTLWGGNGRGFALNQKVGQNWGISWEGWGDAEMCILHFVNLVKGGMFPGRRPELAALNNHW